jgi:glutamine---fructose-6-phosphate transaminase (isomerizing)
MCGIFGFVSDRPRGMDETTKLTARLFQLSESRGKEASGLTIIPATTEDLFVMRSPKPASALIKTSEYKSAFKQALHSDARRDAGMALFGHTRLVTNGAQTRAENNQPVVYQGGVIVHNGIIVNVDDLWAKNPDLERRSEVDTEIIIALIRKHIAAGQSPIEATRTAFSQIQGTASVVVAFNDLRILILATNNGSLYTATSRASGTTYFASESFILRQLAGDLASESLVIAQVAPNRGILIHLDNHAQQPFSLTGTEPQTTATPSLNGHSRRIFDQNIGHIERLAAPVKSSGIPADLEARFAKSLAAAQQLRRCTKCIMPETVPFISFDASGVCNFCRMYKPIELQGAAAFDKLLEPHRRNDGKPDCVAALSGGRDSCFGLHYLVKEKGMKPITYTYDWGMVTDLARRNVSRVCASLGIENIIISADIGLKRTNIRKNVSAWLDKPHLGMVPLFMAGDKEFVWFAQRIKKQNDLALDIFSFNLMEKTQFKEEYSGAQLWTPGEDADQFGEKLRMMPRLQLGAFYTKQFLGNRGYLNKSLLDTFWGYIAYYFLPQTFVSLFNYIPWREDLVVDLIRKEFDWEIAPDTDSTWRIGDGTTGFYNYIYLTLGGFTENDTLRSNQIREGQMDRATALALAERDNRPRWDNLRWYFDVIQMDLASSLRRVHDGPKQHGILEV